MHKSNPFVSSLMFVYEIRFYVEISSIAYHFSTIKQIGDKDFSKKLITKDTRFNVRMNISQDKSRLWNQITVLLKLLLLHTHQRGVAMVI